MSVNMSFASYEENLTLNSSTKPYTGLTFPLQHQIPIVYWRAQNVRLWHGVWSCPASQEFWDQIVTYIRQHWKLVVPKSPELLLFHCTRPPEGNFNGVTGEKSERSWLPGIIHTILLLAKQCLFKHWLDTKNFHLNNPNESTFIIRQDLHRET